MSSVTTADIDPNDIIAAVRAGMDAITGIRAKIDVEYKVDESPVTVADRAAETAITSYLEARYKLPIVAEERFSAGRIPEVSDVFLLVDPLDGTKSYIAGKPDYTVNIAVVEKGVPVFGCVGVPETGAVYYGGLGLEPALEKGGETVKLGVRQAGESLDVVASRNHLSPETTKYLDGLTVADRKSIGSSLKICMIAEGKADLYPRFGRTMQWDTAAGDAVLRAAGGRVVTVSGEPLAYGRTHEPDEDIYANGFFIALGDPALLDRDGVLPKG
ncbi:putative transmembrane protein [Fulvimarina pelagi HTCC2506]|uniref:3'(2'),5'-bisphosphate nucleotidase CysQ n=2 Tax=Fulvimarina pelagi TaxID=217511 RepID=Q0G311_9HYPH|nr:inositol monophosphatase family protein [Fulvimarina pelagi]EAU42020.1 putative transmembrane protein [Fulvimarina pelagi HTCC2506]BAT30995.1 putative transmembrane protein [Fulvimarina pelagi]